MYSRLLVKSNYFQKDDPANQKHFDEIVSEQSANQII
jgi:hypothetical protein